MRPMIHPGPKLSEINWTRYADIMQNDSPTTTIGINYPSFMQQSKRVCASSPTFREQECPTPYPKTTNTNATAFKQEQSLSVIISVSPRTLKNISSRDDSIPNGT